MKQELRIQMRFDGETQRKLDELRRLDPELPTRTDMIRPVHRHATDLQIRHTGTGQRLHRNAGGAITLCVREQGNQACIWALVDPEAKQVKRKFLAAETGNMTIPEDSRYLGTCMLDAGSYVLHLLPDMLGGNQEQQGFRADFHRATDNIG